MSIPDNNSKYTVTEQLDHLEEYGEQVEVIVTYRGKKVLGSVVTTVRDRIIFAYGFALGWLASMGYEIDDLDVHLERLPIF